MNIARIRVQQNTLELDQTTCVIKGMVGATVIFEHFSPEWDGLSKTVVFRTTKASRDVPNVQEGEPVVIPWEVLDAVLVDLQIGVCGRNSNGTQVLPTVWGSLGQITVGAIPVGRPGQPPTPDWTAQIEGQVNRTLTEALAVRPLAQQAADAASAAEESAESAASSAGTAARHAQYASQQANESKECSEISGKAMKLALENGRTAVEAQGAAAVSADGAKSSAEEAAACAATASAHAGRAMQEANKAASAADRAISQGVTGARPGDIFIVNEVNERGEVTSWKPVPPSETEGVYEKIETIKAPGDGVPILRTAEPDGTPYNFKALIVKFHFTEITQESFVHFYTGPSRKRLTGIYTGPTIKNTYMYWKAEPKRGYWDIVESSKEKKPWGQTDQRVWRDLASIPAADFITKIDLGILPKDSEVQIIGVRA